MKPMPHPCDACPWRKSNLGKPHPHGWYTKANLRRLWNGLRTGEAPGMTCHPTDPNNEVPEGSRGVPVGIETRECAGSLLLITRELRLLEADTAGYLKVRTRVGLSKAGAQHWVLGRVILGGTPLGTGEKLLVIEEDPDIQYAPLEKSA